MYETITYRQLENILLHAEFDRLQTRGRHLVYVHRGTGVRIVLPPPRLKSVPAVYIRAVGKALDDYGIMPAEEFFHLVAEKEL
jgi:predicted RNA binding protein YcfA (HicA-like mRNA interferase family)